MRFVNARFNAAALRRFRGELKLRVIYKEHPLLHGAKRVIKLGGKKKCGMRKIKKQNYTYNLLNL